MLRSRRRLTGPLGVLLGLAIAFPLGVLAAISFSDVPVGHPFYYDIQAVADKGVTTGCGGGNYCPDSNVTRGQMAAFMNRLGALGPDKTPVVNADKVDGYHAADLLKVAPIKQQHFGPWTPNGTSSNFTTTTFTNAVRIDAPAAGTGWAQLPLVAATSIGGMTYGLSSVEFCTLASSNNVTIFETLATDGTGIVLYDTIIREPGGCYTVTDPTPNVVGANQVFLIGLSFTNPGSLLVTSTTSTWVPTTLAPVKASSKASGTTSR